MTDTRRWWAAEDGTAATQLAVLMPAVLLLVMLTVQFALWAHGSHLAAASSRAHAPRSQSSATSCARPAPRLYPRTRRR